MREYSSRDFGLDQ